MTDTPEPKTPTDPFAEFTIKFRALPAGLPPSMRLKRLLKFALRACQFANMGFVDTPPAAQDARHAPPAPAAGSRAAEPAADAADAGHGVPGGQPR